MNITPIQDLKVKKKRDFSEKDRREKKTKPPTELPKMSRSSNFQTAQTHPQPVAANSAIPALGERWDMVNHSA